MNKRRNAAILAIVDETLRANFLKLIGEDESAVGEGLPELLMAMWRRAKQLNIAITLSKPVLSAVNNLTIKPDGIEWGTAGSRQTVLIDDLPKLPDDSSAMRYAARILEQDAEILKISAAPIRVKSPP